jgi:dTMP kinase
VLGGVTMTPWAEATLFAAARAELVERVIEPALGQGADVVCDRYIDSSLAYQGLARDLGVDFVLQLNLRATRGLLPDRTILLLLDPEEALRRSTPTDRIEREDDGFFARVDAAYRELAEMFPQRVYAFDGRRPPDELAREIRERLRQLS